MTVADPYYACCGGQICERCADLFDLHRLSKRKCPLCGKGVEGPSRDCRPRPTRWYVGGAQERRRAGALLARGHGGRAQRGGAGAAFVVIGGTRGSPSLAACVSSNRRVRRGDGVVRRQHAIDATPSMREASRRWRCGSTPSDSRPRHLRQACIDHGFVSDGLRWWILAGTGRPRPGLIKVE